MSDIDDVVVKITNITYSNEDVQEDEWYLAKLAHIEKKESVKGDNPYYLSYRYELLGETFAYEYEGQTRQKSVWGSTPIGGKKFKALCEKILDRELPEGSDFKPSELIGKECMIMVKKVRKTTNGEEREYLNIDKVKASKAAPQSKPSINPDGVKKPGDIKDVY